MRSPRASSPSSRPASPRRASAGGAAFGSSSPRQLELWVGRFHETLQGGGTFNERASRAPGTYSDRPSSPGPGDYEASPSATNPNPNRNRNRNRNPHPHPHPNPNPNQASPSAFSRGAPGRDALRLTLTLKPDSYS